jgi:xanthine/uracil permease
MIKYQSRKFIVAMATIASTTGLAAFGKMSGDVATVLLAVNLGYHAANAWIATNNGKK